MQFILICKDGTDTEALQRRLNAREAHLQNTDKHAANIRMAAATLNEQGDMNGSVMVVDFPDRAALDAWLQGDPYTIGDVWRDVTVVPCKIASAFLK